LFTSTGCALCHTPTLKTGNSTVEALRYRPVNLFSDILAHAMGPGLADNIVQGGAQGDEFRTAPLWGLGQRIFFLHDGRTTNLIEAIRAPEGTPWHLRDAALVISETRKKVSDPKQQAALGTDDMMGSARTVYRADCVLLLAPMTDAELEEAYGIVPTGTSGTGSKKRGGKHEAFRRELQHFYECVTEGRAPETPGREGLEDVRLQIDMIKAALR